MAGEFKINKDAIRKITRELEDEFAKNPVKVPLEADPSALSMPSATTVHNYHGPVVTVNGDHAQIAWQNDEVRQTQRLTQTIAPGYEDLARLITYLLASLPALGLDSSDEAEVQSNADTLLGEVVKAEPNRKVIKHGVTMLKGLLASIGAGIGAAVSDEAAELARGIINSLGNSVPS